MQEEARLEYDVQLGCAMSVDPREPLEAIILPDAVERPRPARRRNLLLVGVLGILLLAIVAVVGLAAFLGFSRDGQALA